MKRIISCLIVIIIAAISFKCQKEYSGEGSPSWLVNSASSPITATLQGNIVDENGVPAAGVKIAVAASFAITNSSGYFRIVHAALDKNASLVTAEQAGYFKAYRTFGATAGVNQVVIQLIKKNLAGTVKSVAGGEVRFSNGAAIELPAGGIVNAAGGIYTGNVKVYAVYIDPTAAGINNNVPGSFMANNKENQRGLLSSFGMLAVELETEGGAKLQIAPGSTARLTTPIPRSSLLNAPASISLCYLNERTGIWQEEGKATRKGNKYVGEVKHFSFWNFGIYLPAVGFTTIFKTADDSVLRNISIKIIGYNNGDSSGIGYCHGFTDSLGQVSGLLPYNMPLQIQLIDQCNTVVFRYNIGPFLDYANLGTIVIPASLPALVTIKGKLISCNNLPVTNGYAMVQFNNYISYISTNEEGEFSTSFINCTGAAAQYNIMGIDENAQQQGTVMSIPLVQLNQLISIDACGNSTSQYINYTLDGTDYVLSSNDGDMFTGGTLMPLMDFLQGYNTTLLKQLDFSFNGNGTTGIFPISSLSVKPYNSIQPPISIQVNLTGYPKHIGEFYEGSFSGSFIDSSALNVTHIVSCNFRVGKKY